MRRVVYLSGLELQCTARDIEFCITQPQQNINKWRSQVEPKQLILFESEWRAVKPLQKVQPNSRWAFSSGFNLSPLQRPRNQTPAWHMPLFQATNDLSHILGCDTVHLKTIDLPWSPNISDISRCCRCCLVFFFPIWFSAWLEWLEACFHASRQIHNYDVSSALDRLRRQGPRELPSHLWELWTYGCVCSWGRVGHHNYWNGKNHSKFWWHPIFNHTHVSIVSLPPQNSTCSNAPKRHVVE